MSRAEITGRDPRSGSALCVTIADGLIARVERVESDCDSYLSAGLVDLQVNGYGGFDVNAEGISDSTVVGLVQAMLSNGVTCFAPTLISAREEEICERLKLIAEFRRANRKLAPCIAFVHVEGPHLSAREGYRGAHAAEDMRSPSIEEFDRWQKAGSGIVGMVTMSPHFPESAEYISALVERGIHVSIGHTHASPEQIRRAVDAGATLSTHLGNGIAEEIPRHMNPIWSQLAEDRLTAMLIADGHHLPADLLKVMLRAKGVDRCVMVSDSVALAGMAPGIYTTPVGGRVELRADGRLCLAGSELLAGSTAKLAECVGRVVGMTGVSLADALLMATENPGKFAGERGKIAPGCRGDLVRFRWSGAMEIEDVWLGGEHVWSAPA